MKRRRASEREIERERERERESDRNKRDGNRERERERETYSGKIVVELGVVTMALTFDNGGRSSFSSQDILQGGGRWVEQSLYGKAKSNTLVNRAF